MEWPKTKSNSSATTESMGVPDYGSSPDRITVTGKEGETGDEPIRVSEEVKYKEYENDKRMTEDFATGPDNSDKTAGYDGTETEKPMGEEPRSYVVTEFSKK